MRKAGSAFVVALLLVTLVPSVAEGATRLPSVKAVRAPENAVINQTFSADVVVVNKLARRTATARLKIVLSKNQTADADDVRVATIDVPELKAGARRTYKVDVVPKQAGARYLIACIGQSCRTAPVRVTKPGQDPALPPPPGNPLDVTPVLDTAHAASALVPADTGGTITATGLDGSVFVLDVPPDGVLTDEQITLTPVTSLSGKPFAGAMSAVDITPHGLQLGQLATLTITPPDAIPLTRQLVFATREAGKDFHAYPPTQETSAISLQLSHFSDYGVGNATSTERAAAKLRAPADAQAQIEKLIGDQAQEMKREGNFDGDQLVPYLLDYYRRVVKPRLDAAVTDDTLAVLAMASFLGWTRTSQLVAADHGLSEQATEGFGLVLDVIQNAFDKGFDRCMNRETAYAPALLMLARMVTILGGPESVSDQAIDRLQKCARFELDFDARVREYTRDDRSQGHVEEEGDVEVAASDVALITTMTDAGRFETAGTQDLVVTEWLYYNSASYATDWAAGNAELVAPLRVEATIPLSSRLETSADGRTKFVLNRGRPWVEIDPGKLKLYYTKGNPAYQFPSLFVYEGSFRSIWTPELIAARPGFFRFTAFFDESLPKLGLYLEERSTHREFDQFITDRFSRLRMELEHAPKR
ncbi:hypothetical protein F0U44_20030 [Nocardioides humilatus]|uniref:Uncharacterized protein n=1 Tax=Nocardioides humilatus TaxID=2607660 RepID=A0A5B1L5X4_9ACTN|nr:hypothetical protein [Nocardioides humilatus]KAA1415924.1 hypothetical protein F0U44_20030 [Nocardioides humilatus]